jgi:LAO/AO transport system kinase
MEMADAIVINKADGDNIPKAERAKREYENALHLFPPAPTGWTPRVMTCSALNKTGIQETWALVMEYIAMVKSSGWFKNNRSEQALHAFASTVENTLLGDFYNNPLLKSEIGNLQSEILTGKTSPYTAAQKLVKLYLGK